MIRFLIYLLSAVALWLLWDADNSVLWWSLFIVCLLNYLTGATVKTAIRQAAQDNPLIAVDPGLAAYKQYDGSTDVVRFWVRVNMAISIVTLALAITGIVIGL